MDIKDTSALRDLYNRNGYGSIRGQLDEWDDLAMTLKLKPKKKLTPCSYHKGFIEDCGCSPNRNLSGSYD